MGVTNLSVFEGASTTFRTLAEEVFSTRPPGVYQDYTEIVPTDSKVIEHNALESMPVVREWRGAKQFKDVLAVSASYAMKSHEVSFRIGRKDIITDRTGTIGKRIAAFLNDTKYIYDKLAHEALIANAAGIDGVALISNAHPRGPSGNQSNTTTSALSHATFEAAMVAGASLRDIEGESFGISYDMLRVGPKLAGLAREITGSNERVIAVANDGLEAGTRVAAATGPNARGQQVFTGGAVRVVVDHRLVGTYDDYWYLFDTTRGTPAIVGYELRAPEAIALDRMDDDARFHRDEFLYSIECDVVFVPGVWQGVYGGIVS